MDDPSMVFVKNTAGKVVHRDHLDSTKCFKFRITWTETFHYHDGYCSDPGTVHKAEPCVCHRSFSLLLFSREFIDSHFDGKKYKGTLKDVCDYFKSLDLKSPPSFLYKLNEVAESNNRSSYGCYSGVCGTFYHIVGFDVINKTKGILY